MPHLNEAELNDLAGLRGRLARSDARNRGTHLPPSTLVGNRLLHTLLDAYDAQMGWLETVQPDYPRQPDPQPDREPW